METEQTEVTTGGDTTVNQPVIDNNNDLLDNTVETANIESDVEKVVEATENISETGGEKQPQSKSQNAKQRLRRLNREQAAEIERLKAETEANNKRFSELEAKIDPIINPPAPRPDRIDFDSEEEYEDKLIDWRIGQLEKPSEPSAQSVPVQEPSNQHNQYIPPETLDKWNDTVDDAIEKYDDFQQVALRQDLPITEAMSLAIMESKNGGDIIYLLGKNESEAKRIAQLGFTAQVLEIQKLGEKFVQKTTSAPDPINTLSGSGDDGGSITDPLLEGATFS